MVPSGGAIHQIPCAALCTINNIGLATWVFEGALTETDLRQQSRIYLGIHLSHETGAGPSP